MSAASLQRTFFIRDEEEMVAFGAQWAECLSNHPSLLFLYGDLGAGKTTWVRGLLRGLGYQGSVKSPTYTIVEPYELPKVSIFHFDLYRLTHPEELEFIGIHDYFATPAIVVIEWPEKGGDVLPKPDLCFYLQPEGVGRRIQIEAKTPRGATCLSAI